MKRFIRLFQIALLFSITLIEITCNSNVENLNNNSNEYFVVTKIVDGDTFWIENGESKKIKIRLIGVNTPESRKSKSKNVEYFGKEAKEYLINLIDNKKVRIEFDIDKTDQYKRTLAYVFLDDGTFLNAELVKQGYATVMTIPPNVKYADEFVKLQNEARENNRGLWGIPIE